MVAVANQQTGDPAVEESNKVTILARESEPDNGKEKTGPPEVKTESPPAKKIKIEIEKGPVKPAPGQEKSGKGKSSGPLSNPKKSKKGLKTPEGDWRRSLYKKLPIQDSSFRLKLSTKYSKLRNDQMWSELSDDGKIEASRQVTIAMLNGWLEGQSQESNDVIKVRALIKSLTESSIMKGQGILENSLNMAGTPNTVQKQEPITRKTLFEAEDREPLWKVLPDGWNSEEDVDLDLNFSD